MPLVLVSTVSLHGVPYIVPAYMVSVVLISLNDMGLPVPHLLGHAILEYATAYKGFGSSPKVSDPQDRDGTLSS